MINKNFNIFNNINSKDLFSLKVPATAANLGSGFDTLGMAFNLYNIFNIKKILRPSEFKCVTSGEGTEELSDVKDNMLITSYLKACSEWNVKDALGFELESCNAVPFCRGLGSSSTAVVAGVLFANLINKLNISEPELLRMMTLIEGHPDNVAPCFIGGMVASCWDPDAKTLKYVKLPALPDDLYVVAAVPDFKVQTEEARKILPSSVPFKDAVFNVSHAALLCAAWSTGRWDLLKTGMDDKLHQAYRAKLFPGGEKILENIKNYKDCLAVAISGSGPTMIAIVKGKAGDLASEMCRIFTAGGVSSHFFILNCAPDGVIVEVNN